MHSHRRFSHRSSPTIRMLLVTSFSRSPAVYIPLLILLVDHASSSTARLFLMMCVNGHILAHLLVTSPLGTRGSFFMKHSNQNVRIPIYFVYRGILIVMVRNCDYI